MSVRRRFRGSREERAQGGRQVRFVLEFAFPHRQNRPAHILQAFSIAHVARRIARDLGRPIIPVAFRNAACAPVAMPKATVNEPRRADGASLPEHQDANDARHGGNGSKHEDSDIARFCPVSFPLLDVAPLCKPL
jgi:hypothetical protein